MSAYLAIKDTAVVQFVQSAGEFLLVLLEAAAVLRPRGRQRLQKTARGLADSHSEAQNRAIFTHYIFYPAVPTRMKRRLQYLLPMAGLGSVRLTWGRLLAGSTGVLSHSTPLANFRGPAPPRPHPEGTDGQGFCLGSAPENRTKWKHNLFTGHEVL